MLPIVSKYASLYIQRQGDCYWKNIVGLSVLCNRVWGSKRNIGGDFKTVSQTSAHR